MDKEDGFSYAVNYRKAKSGKTIYEYMCEDCGKIICPYNIYRVKGHVRCFSCKVKFDLRKDK